MQKLILNPFGWTLNPPDGSKRRCHVLGDPAELRPGRKAAFMRKETGERVVRMEHQKLAGRLTACMAAHLRGSLLEAHE